MTYKTTEHFYQYKCAIDAKQNSLAAQILKASTALQAKILSYQISKDYRGDSTKSKTMIEIISKACTLKFNQNPELEKFFLDTETMK